MFLYFIHRMANDRAYMFGGAIRTAFFNDIYYSNQFESISNSVDDHQNDDFVFADIDINKTNFGVVGSSKNIFTTWTHRDTLMPSPTSQQHILFSDDSSDNNVYKECIWLIGGIQC